MGRVTQLDLSAVRQHIKARDDLEIAAADFLELNTLSVFNSDDDYELKLWLEEGYIIFQFDKHPAIVISSKPYRKIIADYALIVESYEKIRRNGDMTPSSLETVDMARRGLHNEGAETLKTRLQGKITLDFETSRRLFTLLCIILSEHIYGLAQFRYSRH